MGTPHAGASIATFGSIVADIASMFVKVSKKNLRDLRKDSDALRELSFAFGNLQRHRQEQGKGLNIVAFTETDRTKIGIKRTLVRIFPKEPNIAIDLWT
jgi:hypothetical protein